MNIFNLMKSLELSESNEDKILDFLVLKEVQIRTYIFDLWNEHSSIPIVQGIVDIIEEEVEVADKTAEKKSIIVEATENRVLFQEERNLPVVVSHDQSGDILQIDSSNQSPMSSKNPSEIPPGNKSFYLPNGKTNQQYLFVFNAEVFGIEDAGELCFEGLDPIGLSFDNVKNVISGIPQTAGEHKIKLRIKRKDWVVGKPILDRTVNLIINPDPKSLWKNIPTPTDIEYYKPDGDKCFIKVETIQDISDRNNFVKKDIVAASQRGRSHAQEGKPRDDDFAVKYLKEIDWYILSVADGAGSAKASRKGSEIACTTVVKACESLILHKRQEFENLVTEFSFEKNDERRKKMGDALYGILGNAVFKSVKSIEEEARQSGKPLKDYSTTLIVSICKKFSFGWFVGAFWVGDGGIGIYNKETQFLKILGESDSGEYAGQTRFLTMPEITQPVELYRRLRFDIVDDFTALILMTDGITDPKFETDANLLKVEKWNELWQDLSKEVDFSDDNETSADQLLSWLDFWSPGNHDDRTIAILY